MTAWSMRRWPAPDPALADVMEVVRDSLRLVGADNEELRGGMMGGARRLSIPFRSADVLDSDMVR